MLKRLLLELGIMAIKSYIKSSESKKDDKVLDIVQTGATYLAHKQNNTLSTGVASSVNDTKMKG